MAINMEEGEKINFRGNEIIVFEGERIEDKDIPEGYKRYSIRHAQSSSSCPRTIENAVWVNHYGDILSKKVIEFDMADIGKTEKTYTEIRETDEELYIEPWDESMELKEEYISISMAMELDDVNCSLSTMDGRNRRLGEIEDEVGEEVTEEWDKEINERLAHPDAIYSSGRLYNEN